MKRENIVRDKSYRFALSIIEVFKNTKRTNNNFVLQQQLLRSGTSIGANIEEAIGAQSRKDFNAKLFIAYKEARETHYWLRLIRDSKLLPIQIVESLLSDCLELRKILGAILTTLNKGAED